MEQSQPLLRLPTSEELPCSDETPVDNELQNLIPNFLLNVLFLIWRERLDWFFGVDMAIYYLYQEELQPALIPEGFLSIGVPSITSERGRLSYVLWEENEIPPVLAIEIVSQNYNNEYEEKKDKYTQLGVKYYLIYNPDYWQRDQHQPFELYRLEQGEYVLQTAEPYWMPEVGLGIGRSRGTYGGLKREWLFWHDQEGNAYRTLEKIAKQYRQLVEQKQQLTKQEHQQAEKYQKRAERAEKALQEQQQQLAERDLQEQQRQKQVITQLFSLGITIEQIATSYNLTPTQVKEILGRL
ncbi:MAG: Uma2 family endonuclease [Symploca sp. SIO2E6]|nr:Uma2 family endonuclease [Symploca sp. SIO2E6]